MSGLLVHPVILQPCNFVCRRLFNSPVFYLQLLVNELQVVQTVPDLLHYQGRPTGSLQHLLVVIELPSGMTMKILLQALKKIDNTS